MRLALKAHHARSVAGMSLVICLLTLLLSGRTVMLPQLLAGLTRPVNIGLLLAVGFAPITAYLFGGDSLLLEAHASRRLLPVDLTLTSILLTPIILIAAVALAAGDTATALGLARNGGGFAAATLLLLTVTRPSVAATVPVLYFLLISTVGLKADGTVHAWAWLRAQPSPQTCAVSLALLALSLPAFHHFARSHFAARPPHDPNALT